MEYADGGDLAAQIKVGTTPTLALRAGAVASREANLFAASLDSEFHMGIAVAIRFAYCHLPQNGCSIALVCQDPGKAGIWPNFHLEPRSKSRRTLILRVLGRPRWFKYDEMGECVCVCVKGVLLLSLESHPKRQPSLKRHTQIDP